MAKKKKKFNKISVDTSCQIEKIKGNLSWVNALRTSKAAILQSPFLVLYEIKFGIINDWINFYYLVEIEGPQEATRIWTERYGFAARKQKNLVILLGQITNNLASNPINDKNSYLRAIESAIFTALTIVDWNTENYFGSFSANEVVTAQLNSREDYEKFSVIAEKNKFVNLSQYSKDNKTEFLKLKDGLTSVASYVTKYPKVIKALNDVLLDENKANQFQNSKRLADSVILTETPAKSTLLSKDNFHRIGAEILSKKFIDFKTLS